MFAFYTSAGGSEVISSEGAQRALRTCTLRGGETDTATFSDVTEGNGECQFTLLSLNHHLLK